MTTNYGRIAILLLLILTIQFPNSAQDLWELKNLPAHPRLIFLEKEEETLKKRIGKDKMSKKIHEAILMSCRDIDPLPPVERVVEGRRLLGKSRECLRRVFFLSYAFRMTGDKKFLKRAEKELLAVSAFSDWNPSHFLDVAEMTLGVAIGYDWLYDHLSAASRKTIREAILKKGIEPSFDSKYNSWLNISNNWNQVCNAGITLGALAIAEDFPDLARQVANRAIKSIRLPMEDYSPDGAYPEGYAYWGYGTSFNVIFIDAIQKLAGSDFGLSKAPGFLNTADYMLHMVGPTGECFNYSDSGDDWDLQPAMFWFADKVKDPSLLWTEKTMLEKTDAAKYSKNRLLPALLIWGKDLKYDNINAPKSKIWVGGGKNPVALMRTSWTDPNGIYVGLKGGSPSVSHGHMDVGSFVMEAGGVRWAMDFGAQNYHSLETKGIKLWGKEQTAERWQIFRYNNFVHNTLTVDEEFQLANGFAPVSESSSGIDSLSAVTDLTDVYKNKLSRAVRKISIVKAQEVIVKDEIQAGAAEVNVRWTLLTSAEVKITDKKEAILSKDGKTLHLTVHEPAEIQLETRSTVPTHDYDAPNPGTTLLVFNVKIPANTKETTIVKMTMSNEH